MNKDKVSIDRLCEKVGMTRQNFHKARKVREKWELDADFIVGLVFRERSEQPRLGGRKLYSILKAELESAGISIGRDRFFEVLRDNNLLIEPSKRSTRTTDSYHTLPVFTNTFKEMDLTGPNEAWVSDITYIRVKGSFIYLSLITDAWSRKIVGFHAGNSLESIGCQKALEMALKGLPAGKYPVHHSDRGCQYCCHAYVNMLKDADMGISMTEENHCYENALAERVNGILKDEYSLSSVFASQKQATEAIAQAVRLYNNKRPHTSLGYKTPASVHETIS